MEIVSGIDACLGRLTCSQFQTRGPTYGHDDEKIPLLMEAAEDEPRRENLQRQERMERFEALIQRRAKQAAEELEPLTEPSKEDQAKPLLVITVVIF